MAKNKTKKSLQEKKCLSDNSIGDERIAYELISLFAGAMKGLNGGVLPIPSHWQNHLRLSLNTRAGKPPTAEVNLRRRKMAANIIKEKVEAAREGNRRPKLKASKISGTTSSRNIYRETKEHMGNAAADLLEENISIRNRQDYENRKKLMEPIRLRMEKGETAWDLLCSGVTAEEYAAASRYEEYEEPLEGMLPKEILNDREKAIAWTSDGMNRHIHAPGQPKTFILQDEADKAIVKALTKKNKFSK